MINHEHRPLYTASSRQTLKRHISSPFPTCHTEAAFDATIQTTEAIKIRVHGQQQALLIRPIQKACSPVLDRAATPNSNTQPGRTVEFPETPSRGGNPREIKFETRTLLSVRGNRWQTSQLRFPIAAKPTTDQWNSLVAGHAIQVFSSGRKHHPQAKTNGGAI